MKINSYEMLYSDLSGFYTDPVGYAMWAFPWGEPNTHLEHYKGLRSWQKKFLEDIAVEVTLRNFDGHTPVNPIQMAVASGGIGKSALTAMIIKWVMDTRPYAKGVVTANTREQLTTKTWGELAKWHNMSITSDLFEYHNSKGNMCLFNKQNKDTWRVDALTCDKEKAEAFAGLHVANSTPFVIFDEAGGIEEPIWDQTPGSFTDGEPMWFVFGNPTKPSGSFRDCFGDKKHRWNIRHIDSREVEDATNKELIESWIEDDGIESDWIKVHVRGIFPSKTATQLISEDLVLAAKGKQAKIIDYVNAPIILGVDVARYGDDKSVIYKRQGIMSWKLGDWRGLSLMDLADIVANFEDSHRADAVFIDVGMGAGVIDRLRQLGREPLEVNFGSKSMDKKCANKRAEMWCSTERWLARGGCIPDDKELCRDLISQEYRINQRDLLILTSKEEMKRAGLKSPDDGDALALTFASPVYVQTPEEMLMATLNSSGGVETKYDMFAGVGEINAGAMTGINYDLFK